MKPTNLLLKKAAMLPLVFISLSCFSQPALSRPAAADHRNAVNIEFVRTDGEYLLFDVDLAGAAGQGCRLKIFDATGETIFEQWIHAAPYRKLYKIERNELEKISFEARGKNFRVNESFDLRFKSEEKLEVTKL